MGRNDLAVMTPAQGAYLTGHGARAIDWEYLVARKPAVLKHSSLPPYLLLPEIRQLQAVVRHANHHLLFSTLWHTGVRVSELLALTPGSFDLNPRGSYVSIQTLKLRGRPRRGAIARRPARLVPITDPVYVREIETYFATQGVRRDERIWQITRHAVAKRLQVTAQALADAGGPNLVGAISPHTFRHSFAVNAILHGVPLTVVQAWLGHKNLSSTAIYTQVLAAETGHLMQWVEF
jgi:integrase